MLSAACSALMIGSKCFITDGNDGAGGGGGDGAPAPKPLSADGPTPAEFVAAGYKIENYPPSGYAAKNEDGTLVDPTQVEQAEGLNQPAANLTAAHTATEDAPLGADQSGSAVAGAGAEPLAAAAVQDGQDAAVENPGAGTTVLGLALPQIVTLVGMIAYAVNPAASVAGFTIAQLTNLALAVAAGVPAAVQAFDEIKTVASSGLPPTAEQWASWNAAADLANARASAAEDAVINGNGK